MTNRPIRKKIRLENYDYSGNGAYFVTICTKDKMCILWDNRDKYGPLKQSVPLVGAHSVRPKMSGKIHLSEYGKCVKMGLKNINVHYPMVFTDKYVIMPNHIHVIIRISNDVADRRTVCAPTLSLIIKQFKEYVTKQIGFSIWQKSFYDRIIRNEREYSAFREYIEANPENWESDELFIQG